MSRYEEIQNELDIMSMQMDEEDFKLKPYSEVKVFIKKYLALSDEQNLIKKHGRSRRLKDKTIENTLKMLDDLDKMRISSKVKYERFKAKMREGFKKKVKDKW